MQSSDFSALAAAIGRTQVAFDIGRVTSINQNTLSIKGLSKRASIGDQVEITRLSGESIGGEILNIAPDSVSVLPDGDVEGIVLGAQAKLIGPNVLFPSDQWVGRVIDPAGNALDGKTLNKGAIARPLRSAPPKPAGRRAMGERLETGLAVFNTLLPIAKGQRIGLFSGSGVGKSTLLSNLSQGVQADIVVVALIGERGREVREFVENVLGPEGMKRAIVVAATSDQSPLIRRRCAFSAMAIAEHFRDQGLHVLLLADSITRFAEAHREVALPSGEEASLKGFPPSTSSSIMALCERAGPGAGMSGDITAVFTVLVAGSDMEEPIADILRGVLDGHVVLDRSIAERGRFPAIDLLQSVSRSLPAIASEVENQCIRDARQLLGTYDKAEMMIQAGLYSHGTDSQIDAAIEAWPLLDEFITLREGNNINQSFEKLAQCLTFKEADPSTNH
ncbi:FliI/YscN family ATPase [Falsihalocynthiibacter sp. SS001]|uniref:FliI/YscN family ATPase n=1 Tax=Falsihalocynthiibacter sp. SS001 TaxID=3349698 RepID=UPI0036D20DB2